MQLTRPLRPYDATEGLTSLALYMTNKHLIHIKEIKYFILHQLILSWTFKRHNEHKAHASLHLVPHISHKSMLKYHCFDEKSHFSVLTNHKIIWLLT
jgi:hypothetical protein